MQKKLLFLSTLLATTLTHAETCPSPSEIKTNQLNHWIARNINSAEILSPHQLEDFEKNITPFEAAMWMPDAPEGAGQCYYQEVEVYLTKDTHAPDEKTGAWYPTSLDNKICHASVNQCRFRDD